MSQRKNSGTSKDVSKETESEKERLERLLEED
jgi:hypothetical protein